MNGLNQCSVRRSIRQRLIVMMYLNINSASINLSVPPHRYRRDKIIREIWFSCYARAPYLVPPPPGQRQHNKPYNARYTHIAGRAGRYRRTFDPCVGFGSGPTIGLRHARRVLCSVCCRIEAHRLRARVCSTRKKSREFAVKSRSRHGVRFRFKRHADREFVRFVSRPCIACTRVPPRTTGRVRRLLTV